MSEENDKKIDYKILTAEHLVTEKEAEKKETNIPKEEFIEPEPVKKVEGQSFQSEISLIPEENQETIKMEEKSESGVINPVAEEIPLNSVFFGLSQSELEQPLPDQKPSIELPSFKPEEFIISQEEPISSQASEVKPKFEIFKSEELIGDEPVTETVIKKKFKVPSKLILVPVVVMVLGFTIFLVKPQKFFVNRLGKQISSPAVSSPENLALKLPELKKTTEPLILVTSGPFQETSSVNELVVATTATSIINLSEKTSTVITTVTTTIQPIVTTTTDTLSVVVTTTKNISTPTTITTTKTMTTKTMTTKVTVSNLTTSNVAKETTTTKDTLVSSQLKTSTLLATNTLTLTNATPTENINIKDKKVTTTENQETSTKLTLNIKNIPTTSSFTTISEPYFTANGELISVKEAMEVDLSLKTLTLEEFGNQLKKFLIWQYFYNTLINIRIIYNNNVVSPDIILSYFIKPTKLNQSNINNFKQSLTNKFSFLIYYGYTRKYPLIIFETKNPKLAQEFNNQWMKNGMSQDLRTLFLDINPGKEVSNFVFKKYDNIGYNIIYFENNLQIVWLIFNNYLIYASNEESVKQIISDLKN